MIKNKIELYIKIEERGEKQAWLTYYTGGLGTGARHRPIKMQRLLWDYLDID